MKVFISWSGDYSRKLAEEVRTWLPGALQFVRPYFTPNDVEKGARWNTDIASQLEESQIGIFCVTRDSLSSAWMLFEAGALSKKVDKSRICPILFGVDDADLKGPLTQFQNTKFNKADFKKLFETINQAAESNKLEKGVLESVFEMWWPKLESAIQKIQAPNAVSNDDEVRSDREILEEILALSRLGSEKTRRPRVSEADNDAMEYMAHRFVHLWNEMATKSHPRDVVKYMHELRDVLMHLSRKNRAKRWVSMLDDLPKIHTVDDVPF